LLAGGKKVKEKKEKNSSGHECVLSYTL
jgi:hypothetical protein